MSGFRASASVLCALVSLLFMHNIRNVNCAIFFVADYIGVLVGNGGQKKKRLVGQERMKNQFPKGNMTVIRTHVCLRQTQKGREKTTAN